MMQVCMSLFIDYKMCQWFSQGIFMYRVGWIYIPGLA